MAKTLGIDLGTAFTRVCLPHEGIILRAPSVVSLENRSHAVLAAGAEAKRILAEGRQDYPTIPEYLAQIDALCMDKQAVVYDEERGAWLTF